MQFPVAGSLLLLAALIAAVAVLPGNVSAQEPGPAAGAEGAYLPRAPNGTAAAPSPLAPLPPGVTLPAIADDHRAGTIERTYSFAFGTENVTIVTNVSSAAYHGAKKGDKFAVAPPGIAIESLIPFYFRAFIDDPHQDRFFQDLVAGFRSLRDRGHYTDDEYLELMTVFVQVIPYDAEAGIHPDNPARFPVETIVEGSGDCDDKSLLLAGLLSREGYDVALLFFAPEHHMAIGVRNESHPFRDTGYLYVETTHLSLVGEVPENLNLSQKYKQTEEPVFITVLNSTPVVIRVGSGTRQYTGAGETEYILGQKQETDIKILSLRQQMNGTLENTTANRTLVADYNRYAEIHNYIVRHRYDRAGTYRYLRSLVPAPATPQPVVTAPACPWPEFAWNLSAGRIIPGPCS